MIKSRTEQNRTNNCKSHQQRKQKKHPKLINNTNKEKAKT